VQLPNLQCPPEPASPDPDSATDADVADYIVDLVGAYRVCAKVPDALRAVVGQ